MTTAGSGRKDEKLTFELAASAASGHAQSSNGRGAGCRAGRPVGAEGLEKAEAPRPQLFVDEEEEAGRQAGRQADRQAGRPHTVALRGSLMTEQGRARDGGELSSCRPIQPRRPRAINGGQQRPGPNRKLISGAGRASDARKQVRVFVITGAAAATAGGASGEWRARARDKPPAGR